MTRLAVIEKHDMDVAYVRHGDSVSDAAIMRDAVSSHYAHNIRRITIYQSGVVFDNLTTLEIAIRTAERLTS